MASFINRLKTVIFCTFLIAVLTISALFCYALRYSYHSKLEFKYLGTLNLKTEKDFVESEVMSTHSSRTNSSIQSSDNVYFLQESSRSKHTGQKIKTKMWAIDNKKYRNKTSNNSLTNHSADGSIALHRHNHEQKAGVASDGSNAVQDLGEILCPRSPSTLGESRFLNILVQFILLAAITCLVRTKKKLRSVKSVN